MSLREERKKAGLSQAGLAGSSGVSRRAIQQWEANGMSTANLGKVRKVAATLGCPIGALLDGEGGGRCPRS